MIIYVHSTAVQFCRGMRLANVHKLRAEIRYLTNLRNLRELFRYPSPENPGGRRGRGDFYLINVFRLSFTCSAIPKIEAVEAVISSVADARL